LIVFDDPDSDGQRKSPDLPRIEAKAVADWILEKVAGGLKIVINHRRASVLWLLVMCCAGATHKILRPLKRIC